MERPSEEQAYCPKVHWPREETLGAAKAVAARARMAVVNCILAVGEVFGGIGEKWLRIVW